MNPSRTLLFSVFFFLSACAAPPVRQQPDAMPTADTNDSSASSDSGMMTSSSSSAVKTTMPEKAAMKKESSASAEKKQWSSDLSEDQIAVLRDGGTETPFTSDLLDEHRKGTFVSADCGEPVFRSEQKYDSGTGWPSFWAPITADAVIEKTDSTFGMKRTEILSKCGGHLGHVFTDGPQPTGLRYCMNGLALRFVPDPVQ